MFCPTCGSEERELRQYCRVCGTDLRTVRIGLDHTDAISAAAIAAREQVGRAFADKIRDAQTSAELKKMTEEVLPEIEKFLESPSEKRLRRVRNGIVATSIGFGGSLIALLLSFENSDFLPILIPGVVMFFIGLATILNGLLFTLPRKSQNLYREELEHSAGSTVIPPPPQSTNELADGAGVAVRNSVTEHTTHQLANRKQ